MQTGNLKLDNLFNENGIHNLGLPTDEKARYYSIFRKQISSSNLKEGQIILTPGEAHTWSTLTFQKFQQAVLSRMSESVLRDLPKTDDPEKCAKVTRAFKMENYKQLRKSHPNISPYLEGLFEKLIGTKQENTTSPPPLTYEEEALVEDFSKRVEKTLLEISKENGTIEIFSMSPSLTTGNPKFDIKMLLAGLHDLPLQLQQAAVKIIKFKINAVNRGDKVVLLPQKLGNSANHPTVQAFFDRFYTTEKPPTHFLVYTDEPSLLEVEEDPNLLNRSLFTGIRPEDDPMPKRLARLQKKVDLYLFRRSTICQLILAKNTSI